MVAATAAACTKPAPPGPPGVTITAGSATIDYGDAVPAIIASYAGLPVGQSETHHAADLHHDRHVDQSAWYVRHLLR